MNKQQIRDAVVQLRADAASEAEPASADARHAADRAAVLHRRLFEDALEKRRPELERLQAECAATGHVFPGTVSTDEDGMTWIVVHRDPCRCKVCGADAPADVTATNLVKG